ncbi:MAG: tetratricopeptide repeat protein, partial [Muribaculaceae bacterium]|nr:tetratricopeptide repeat protein [Muribaculaceae bacterium]
TEDEVMEKFNRLVTTSATSDTHLSFNDRIKGRVQDRSMSVNPEPAYTLSFSAPEVSLQNVSNYFRELDDINERRFLPQRLYLVAGNPTPSDENTMRRLFDMEETYSRRLDTPSPRPVDFLARGVIRTMLKNYEGAEQDFTKAIVSADNFTTALLARAYVYAALDRPQMASDDLDAALRINPDLVYAWFNKGIIYYTLGDYTSAMQAFENAIRLNPSLGAAYYNRGLCYMHSGNRQAAFSDLSRAGELGVLPSYNLIKRMK